ncbi:MAG: hypothetical protein ACXVCR_13440 [Bdellovibrio sp.]
MVRLLSLCFLFVSSISYANLKNFDVPNLSVEIESNVPSQLPLRSQRVWALEQLGLIKEVNQLDELEQDLLYLKLLKNGQIHSAKTQLNGQDENSQPKIKSNKTIVFFDLNFAPAEIAAVREAARIRGDNLVLIPERTEEQQRDIERQYVLTVKLEDKVRQCYFHPNENCEGLLKQFKDAKKRLDNIVSQIKRVDSASEVFSKMDRDGIVPSVYIFSGHSGGRGLTGVFGSLTANAIHEEIDKHPKLFSNVTSMLLWGCYTGTLSNLSDGWQALFPKVKAFAGYRNRAPLGIRPSSGQLLKSYLLNEQNFLSASDVNKTHKIFKKLDFVADLDATALIDGYYLTYEKAEKVSELFKRCEQFDEKLLTSYSCYFDGQNGCENPPSSHTGPLRNLYSYLQVNRHCHEKLLEKYPTLPTPESLIRLIYFDNIKSNFIQHHSAMFESYNDFVDELNFPTNSKIFDLTKLNRSSIIESANITSKELEKVGFVDGTYINNSNWGTVKKFGEAFNSLKMTLGIQHKYSEWCVPFSWVEENAKEIDGCGFDMFLERPLPEIKKEILISTFYEESFFNWVKNEIFPDPLFLMVVIPESINSIGIKPAYRIGLERGINDLTAKQTLTDVQKKRLDLYKYLYQISTEMDDGALRTMVLNNLENTIKKINELMSQARNEPYGNYAISNLEIFKNLAESSYEKINKL